MKKRISNIDVFQAGKVQAVTAFCISLIFVPFMLLFALFGHGQSFIMAIVMAVIMPILYTLGGFIGGLIFALVYNLVAGWTGGIEFTITDVAPPGTALPGSYSPTQYQP